MQKKRMRALSAVLVVSGVLTFSNAFLMVNAENEGTQTAVPQQDTVSFSAESDGTLLTLHLKGYLPQNWYYKAEDVNIQYDNGGSDTLHCQLNPSQKSFTASLNWNQNMNASMTSNESDHSFDGTVTIPLSSLKSGSFKVSCEGTSVSIQNQQPQSTAEPEKENTSGQATAAPEKLTANTNGKITIDGKSGDWSDVTKQKSNDSAIQWWKAARDTDGNLYLVFGGQAVTQWYGDYAWKTVKIQDQGFNGGSIQNVGGSYQAVNEANGNTAGPYTAELSIPASAIANPNGTVTFAGTQVNMSDLAVLNGKDVTPSEEPAVYKGITIDGKFDDWNAVTKYDAHDPNPEHPNSIQKAAMVFDGDHVYLYVQDGPGQTAAGAGSHSNGKFEIRTDLGRKVVLTFQNDGSVVSDTVSDIQSRHVGDQWEVSLGTAQFPAYQKSISFGLYSVDSSDLSEPFVKDVENIGTDTHHKTTINDGSNIVYDGQYDDWKDYPHTEIEYDTAGTQVSRVDGEAAIYADGSKVLGHVETEMQDHLAEKGGEFLQTVTIRVNREKEFYPEFVTVDSQGKINWHPSFSNAPGSYEYYIVDSQGWASAETVDELNSGKEGNALYGKMTVTVGDGKDECEFYVDDQKLAEKFNMNANDIQYVDERFGRIGQQWVGTTGASTGPWASVAMCAGLAGIGWILRRKHS